MNIHKTLAGAIVLAFGLASVSAAPRPAMLVGIVDSCDPHQNAVGDCYARALERCGHIPLVIPKTVDTNALARLLSRLDAIVITGGRADIDPARYGEKPHPKAHPPDLFRDGFDFTVLRYAAAHRIPVLGICRGEQVMNVCFGGSMYQHIPDYFNGQDGKPVVKHSLYPYLGAATNPPTHTVAIVPGTKLARLLGTNTLAIASHHHQAVKRLAPGFRASAYAPDGVVEAIEGIDLPMIGVQFHPETVVAERPAKGFELNRLEQLFRRLGDFAAQAPCDFAAHRATGTDGAKIAARFKVDRHDLMQGFRRTVFNMEDCKAWVVEPDVPAADGRWVWCMEWPTAFQDRVAVKALLKAGYRWVTFNPASKEVYAGNQNDEMIAKRRAFQKFLVEDLGFAPKCGLIGMSWGGFYSVRYASTHPDCVCAIYLDAPLLDFTTLSKYNDRSGKWSRNGLAKYYPFITDTYDGANDPYQSVNRAEPIAKAGIPMLILYGGQDDVVPPEKNCMKFAVAFEKAGGDLMIERRAKYGHHPHGVEPNEVQRLVNFFDRGYAK